MTFSIVIYDPDQSVWGIGVASKFLAVGALVPWLKPGVGAIATQALANLQYGVEGLKLLEKYDAKETVNRLVASDPLRERRQVGVVDAKGNAFAFTGKECHSYASHIVGHNFTVQGNILAGEEVLEAMARVAEEKGDIIEKVVRALEAGDRAGGDKRGRQSAALIAVTNQRNQEGEIDPLSVGKVIDIRVDDHKQPLRELRRIYEIWRATFMKEEMIDVEEHEEEIKKALAKLGYRDLRTWVEVNNFENKFTGYKIGKNVFSLLLNQAAGDEQRSS
ncbi:hypothetical protein HS7_17640 [Sulfolobales archaeon HS-7]|nr:hypothetical protein HS7_17640 [Sulfolobales archaeon HS-7]